MIIRTEPQSGFYADKVKAAARAGAWSLSFQLGRGSVLLCLSSGFEPAPGIALLETLNSRQERALLDEQPLLLTEREHPIRLQLYRREELEAKQVKSLEFSVNPPLSLPLNAQLWSYDFYSGCAAPNYPGNTVCLRAQVRYTVSRFPLCRSTKVTVSAPGLKGYPDGFLCYRVGDMEYPIPNALLSDAFRLEQRELNLCAASPWQSCFEIIREK